MPQLIRHRTIVDDPWTLLREAASLGDLPDGASIIVPLALWRAQCRAEVAGRALPAGHFLAEERPEETAAELLAFFA